MGEWLLLVRTDRIESQCQEAIDGAVAAEQAACKVMLKKKDEEQAAKDAEQVKKDEQQAAKDAEQVKKDEQQAAKDAEQVKKDEQQAAKDAEQVKKDRERITEITRLEEKLRRASFFEDYAKCPELDGTEATVGGVKYGLYCNQGVSQASNPQGPQDSSALDFDSCVRSCSNVKWCQGINFWPKYDRPCFRYSKWASKLGTKKPQDIVMGAVPPTQR